MGFLQSMLAPGTIGMPYREGDGCFAPTRDVVSLGRGQEGNQGQAIVLRALHRTRLKGKGVES